MRAALISSGHPSARASAPSSLTSRARSGVWGPLMWGREGRQVDLDDLVVEVGRVGQDLVVGAEVVGDGVGRVGGGLAAGRLEIAAMASS